MLFNCGHKIQFCGCFRFVALGPFEFVHCPHFSTVHGRFPPETRFNQDQVPLPFVVSMENACTLEEDDDARMTCPSESLRKRQFVMHIVVNAGEGDEKMGCMTLTCKGIPNGRREPCEISARDDRVSMTFQKNAWVETVAMIEIAKNFVEKRMNLVTCGC